MVQMREQKLQDSIYKALKYSLNEYGRISHFE